MSVVATRLNYYTMILYRKPIQVRWSDLDPNFHVLHSKYYDYGAYCRMAFLVEHGLTPALMQQYHIGPILFREECIFKKEIGFSDEVSITVKLTSASENYSRWSMQHELYKNDDTLAAIINVDGAWMDTIKRKLATPVPEIISVFEQAPKSADFLKK